jgi:transcriptional regulator with XRE-family HTH domain
VSGRPPRALSVPYVANLENNRGNPTTDALGRLAEALGTRLSITFSPTDAATMPADPIPDLSPTLIRLSRTRRFRRDVQLLAATTGDAPTELAGQLLDLLARLAEVTGREPAEPDWSRLLDALILVTLHPHPRK